MKPYRIVLVDDHILFRAGIRSLISTNEDFIIVGEAGDGETLLGLLREVTPDMAIMDISMPGYQGVEATREAKKLMPDLKVLILTMHNSKEYLYHAMSAGADGYLLKEDAHDDLMTAIRTLQQGRLYISSLMSDHVQDLFIRRIRGEDPESGTLSQRELEVLRLVAEGKSSKEIAGHLFISIMTVQNHRANIKKKLNLRKNIDLVKYAIRKGYVSSSL
jgi:two-component system, NarL family, response regulator NreC